LGECVAGAYCTQDKICAASKADGEPCGSSVFTLVECTGRCAYPESTVPPVKPALSDGGTPAIDAGGGMTGICTSAAEPLNVTAATCGGMFGDL
jgi:hypothetical protein